MNSLETITYDSPLGPLQLVASGDGLVAVLWPEEREGRVRIAEPPQENQNNHILAETHTQLTEYFGGSRTTFDLPLDLRGTEFQVATWKSLASIPFGETATYGEQAARIGRPTAVRAIGAANGRNPVSIVLPCHRVVGSDGSLTGFAGGLEAKWFLLELEGWPGLAGLRAPAAEPTLPGM